MGDVRRLGNEWRLVNKECVPGMCRLLNVLCDVREGILKKEAREWGAFG